MRVIIDVETGEVITQLAPGDRIVKGTSIDYLKDNVKVPKEEQFIKVYRSSVALLNECKLSGAEYGILLYLASNLRYKSNVCKYENGKLLNRDNLQRDMGLNVESIKRSIRTLIKEGIIVEASSTAGKVFILNPFLFNVGDTINKTVYDLFKGSRWAFKV
jgi:hypothetical protein